MARKKKRSDKQLLWRWILALAAVALLMAVLAVGLNHLGLAGGNITDTPTVPTSPPLHANPYGPEDFAATEEGWLTCLAGPSIPGIDVSSHQGAIDWPAVKAAGIEFAFIRLGYRGYDTGTIHVDERALENLRGARAAGIRIGAYFFSQAIDTAEATAEARFALEVLDGTALDLPLVYDWEYVSDTARTATVSSRTLMACIDSFCGAVSNAGYEPMIYFNPELALRKLDLEKLSGYPFWLAFYTDRMTYPHKVTYWQYSDEGRVPGIEGNVDLNLYFPEA